MRLFSAPGFRKQKSVCRKLLEPFYFGYKLQVIFATWASVEVLVTVVQTFITFGLTVFSNCLVLLIFIVFWYGKLIKLIWM
jgi:hypothetical protein